MLEKIIKTDSDPAYILVRFIAGAVFLSEGIQKFLYPDALGVGRFIKIGIPFPEFFAPFVGVVEIVFGLLFLAGLLTRLSAVPLIINMIVAILSTKIPILMNNGFWAMAHEARTDYSMLLASVFLLIKGAGEWSFDIYLQRRMEKLKV